MKLMNKTSLKQQVLLLMAEILHQLIGKLSHIYRVLYIPGGAGFQPSTVSPQQSSKRGGGGGGDVSNPAMNHRNLAMPRVIFSPKRNMGQREVETPNTIIVRFCTTNIQKQHGFHKVSMNLCGYYIRGPL